MHRSDLVLPFDDLPQSPRSTPLRPLLKWIGNKHRSAPEIISCFPPSYSSYIEPFLGTGAVLGALSPASAVASDVLVPLIGIWRGVQSQPDLVKEWYNDRWSRSAAGDPTEVYEEIKASYNASPNPADLLFISRSCYGGVVRFRKADGYISTPCGCHHPIAPETFAARVDSWHDCIGSTTFLCSDFEPVMDAAQPGDVVYCDPPYSDTQSILYGAQGFRLRRLLDTIARCKRRGVYVLLSIDGTKRSGTHDCLVDIPEGLFEREALVDCGRSMLRRFQSQGTTLQGEVVHDRLLMTW